MKITKEEVRHIARLSRLALSADEVETFSGQLNAIIEYVEKLSELAAEDITPTSHVIPLQNVTRSDISAPSLSKEDALKNAPDATVKFYRVPKIIE